MLRENNFAYLIKYSLPMQFLCYLLKHETQNKPELFLLDQTSSHHQNFVVQSIMYRLHILVDKHRKNVIYWPWSFPHLDRQYAGNLYWCNPYPNISSTISHLNFHHTYSTAYLVVSYPRNCKITIRFRGDLFLYFIFMLF